MAMLYHVKNPKTGEDFFFDSWIILNRSIDITYSKFTEKPEIHRTDIGEYCIGSAEEPDLTISTIEHGDIIKEPTHL